ncbi:hypothetical protein KKB11_05675, partial [Candidatus Micrarchaeota archaeon]|nr:hypothetical protein [Candidatus Micrarchaeota archaeon]
MGLKDLYNSSEDKYYKVIDAIDKKIPITKLTDAIDQVIPSFIVLIALILLITGFLLWPFIFPSEEKEYVFSVTVKNENGNVLEGIEAKIF